jgi:hypothetical protein
MASAADRRSAAGLARAAVFARAAGLALLLALAISAFAPRANALAAERGRVCSVYRAPVLNSPDGFVVGYLFRPDPVRILRRTANRRWVRITTSHELRGWVRARYVCRR